MGTAGVVLLVVGAVLFVAGFALALRLRRQGGAPVMSGRWLGVVALTSIGAVVMVVTATSSWS
ncbi:hypothetical protein [Frigoribacterium sp. Leaf186]|uniref:hypothetical protein n=1 Tax=Frigoribacterium sp. Leaf186 TaxID=1736293 RepID=UPI0006FE3082|nr:hypothetical protein [Frigoribacterium sp. Leaf186]KQS17570.1 hypothetical protein ASG05_08940 [Frigoribacterium sp. Leaf186]